MFKYGEIGDATSCFNKAKITEMIFVLLERDKAAPAAIRAWIDERIRIGKNSSDDPQIQEARKVIEYMERLK